MSIESQKRLGAIQFSVSVNAIKIVILSIGILLSLSGCEKLTSPMLPVPPTSETQPLTVMTYNVYIGTSAVSLLGVESLFQIPEIATQLYNNLIASDFPGRAAAIAKSIKMYQPHLIGLQEIMLIRRQSPGDRIIGGSMPAEEVVMDFLEILKDALQAEGLNYQVAARVQNLDIEVPMFAEGAIDDIRSTDFDVILARSDVAVSRVTSTNYANPLTIEAFALELQRGYTAIDATVAGVTYRFVTTHLETITLENRLAQAQELVDSLRDETLPIVLLGDFNTPAPHGTVYQFMLSAGYVDVWQMDAKEAGYTCCQADTLQNEESELSKRIDQIFVRNLGHPASVSTHTIGDKLSEKLASGLWPSNHAGVVAHLTFE